MARIIGEGITFDDVLLVPQYSEVTPNLIDKDDFIEYSDDECGNGYRDRASDGHCDGACRRYRHYSQEYVD